jgi:hypothetical protein
MNQLFTLDNPLETRFYQLQGQPHRTFIFLGPMHDHTHTCIKGHSTRPQQLLIFLQLIFSSSRGSQLSAGTYFQAIAFLHHKIYKLTQNRSTSLLPKHCRLHTMQPRQFDSSKQTCSYMSVNNPISKPVSVVNLITE